MFFSSTPPDILARGVILSCIGLIWVVALVRLNGLRTFSKMTNFDFVMTVAMGSLLAGAAQTSSWSAFWQTLIAMTALTGFQWLIAKARTRWAFAEDILQNRPVLLMRDGEMIDSALNSTRVTRDDVIAKLREANVLDTSAVRAVVLETTGDVSVLHGENLDDRLIEGITVPDRP